MKLYRQSNEDLWAGRMDPDAPSYWHQIIRVLDLEKCELPKLGDDQNGFAILGYDCDDGVTRNQGRGGSAEGPDAIRSIAGSLTNHFDSRTSLVDAGNTNCLSELSEIVTQLLNKNYFPILLGGGHDISYGHFNGIQKFLNVSGASPVIGIITSTHTSTSAPQKTARIPALPFARSPKKQK